MKIFLLLSLLILVFPLASVAYGQISDKTGLKTSHEVVVGGNSYTVEVVANFDVKSISVSENKLTFEIVSSLSNNFGEIQIPHNVTEGQPRFYIDGQEIQPKIMKNEKISFITLEFAGNGTHTLLVSGDATPEQDPAQTVSEEQEDTTSVYTMVVMIAAAAAILTMMYNKRKSKSSN